MKHPDMNRRSRGFTLVEMLAVVGIVLALLVITLLSLTTIRKHLRQRELDSKAETIYVAAQNRMADLRAYGFDSVYQYEKENTKGVQKLNYVPGDSASNESTQSTQSEAEKDETIVEIDADTLCYVTSADWKDGTTMQTLLGESEETWTASALILNTDALSADLLNETWIIEYDPRSGSVYAVFYSEKDEDGNSALMGNNGEIKDTQEKLDTLRGKKARLNDGARVGYYGGDITATEITYELHPGILIENKEELKVTFYCNKPDEYPLTFTVTLSDGNATLKKTFTSLTMVNSQLYKYDWTLDSLKSDKDRFKNQVTGSDLTPGLPLTITLQVDSDSPLIYKTTGSDTATATTNGLFADDSTGEIAHIAYARHLQNLDADSGVAASITSAQQTANISLRDDETNKEDWYTLYTKNGVDFTPIVNEHLKSYTGASKASESSTPVSHTIEGLTVAGATTVNGKTVSGLFGTFSGTELDSITLIGTRIGTAGSTGLTAKQANAAGALVGRTTGTVTISGCSVYLNETEDVEDLQKQTAASAVEPWLKGDTVGGLVGEIASGSTVTIKNSFAATVANGEKTAGGLVGAVNGSLTATGVYADCYLLAETTGGLLGHVGDGEGCSATLENFYAVGYQVASSTAAGLTPGTLTSAKNGYTACSFDGGEAENITVYSTAGKIGTVDAIDNSSESGTNDAVTNVYYLSGTGSKHIPGTTDINYNELRGRGSGNGTITAENVDKKLGSAFSVGTGGSSNPYNLLDQGLSSYSYPRLTGLDHYGDWAATFESGTLVYYEVYDEGNGKISYGFYGANVSALQSDKTVVGDGYAVAFDESAIGSVPSYEVTLTGATETDNVITVNTAGTSEVVTATVTFAKDDAKTVTHTPTGGTATTYYLVPLPNKVTNPVLTGTGTFYQQIKITTTGVSDTYYYNPYFAKTVQAVSHSEDAADAQSVSDTEAAQTGNETPVAPTTISVRTPRQLNGLSLYYHTFAGNTASSRFEQELNLDYTTYKWTDYTLNTEKVSVQGPIGGASADFVATYEGKYHEVTGLGIEADTRAVGLFGTIGQSGIVRNLYLVADTEKNLPKYTVQRTEPTKTGEAAYAFSGSSNNSAIGALAGINRGTITNCAVCGFGTTYYAYNYNTASIGGLVGENSGVIRGCSADAAGVTIAANGGSAVYAGGFVGRNSGTIRNSYAVGLLTAKDVTANSTAWIGGFAGANTASGTNGAMQNCYAGTALSAVGAAESYGFARRAGTAAACYYLDGATCSYAGKLYAYNTSTNEFSTYAAGTATTPTELKNHLSSTFGDASQSYMHTATGDTNYPYPAIVSNANGKVHYGDWPIVQDIGAVGVFYWEREVGGSNAGYHLSYVATREGFEQDQSTGGDAVYYTGSTLCTAHDDGGVITDYGYGYFYSTDQNLQADALILRSSSCDIKDSYKNENAAYALAKQMQGYTFVAYNTADTSGQDGIYMTTGDKNAEWTLTYTGTNSGKITYTFTVCPFFANAISLDEISGVQNLNSGSVYTTNMTKPGKNGSGEANNAPYEIRSVRQLQFLNWNYYEKKATYSITSGNKDKSFSSGATYTYVRSCYPYLLSGAENEKVTSPDNELMLYWTQSHDVDAYVENGNQNKYFTPIGSFYDAGSYTADSKVTIAFFPYSFDGQSYVIRNVEIHSPNQAVGLFGVTAGAQLKNIVMYSDRGNTIERTQDGTEWYSIGGLVGFAGSRKGSVNARTSSVFENCTVSGYTIIDSNANTPGWGGGNVGGLVGTTNMDITSCSAVNDIQLRCTRYEDEWSNLRVGGIAGVARCTISSCYAGGSIVSNVADTYSSVATGGLCIWVGGIAGGIVVRNSGNLKDLVGFVDRSLVVANCYSYTELPNGRTSWGWSDNDGYNHVRISMSIASNGEMMASRSFFKQVDCSNVYIYNCYALDSAVQSTSDYRWYYENYTSKNKSWAGVNFGEIINGPDSVTVYNSGTMYLTYEQMQTDMRQKLNKAVEATYQYGSGWSTTDGTLTIDGGKFSTVTTEEHGAGIRGKYSYPGNDSALQGLDYPFPTVLKQTDRYGQNVNVHYGAWPRFGMLWDRTSATMDLCADYDTAQKAATLTLNLQVYGQEDLPNLNKNNFTFCDDEGNALGAGSPVAVRSCEKQENGSYAVTFEGLQPGTVHVHANAESEDVVTVITVTGELELSAREDEVELCPGESLDLELAVSALRKVSDDSGSTAGTGTGSDTSYVSTRLTEEQLGNLTWTLSLSADGLGEYDTQPLFFEGTNSIDLAYNADATAENRGVATWTAEDVSLTVDEDDNGQYVAVLTLTGALFDAVEETEGTLRITCTHAYGDAKDQTLEAEATVFVSVTAPDFAVLTHDGTVSGTIFGMDAKTGRSGDEIEDWISETQRWWQSGTSVADGLFLRGAYGAFAVDDSSDVAALLTLTIGRNSYELEGRTGSDATRAIDGVDYAVYDVVDSSDHAVSGVAVLIGSSAETLTAEDGKTVTYWPVRVATVRSDVELSANLKYKPDESDYTSYAHESATASVDPMDVALSWDTSSSTLDLYADEHKGTASLELSLTLSGKDAALAAELFGKPEVTGTVDGSSHTYEINESYEDYVTLAVGEMSELGSEVTYTVTVTGTGKTDWLSDNYTSVTIDLTAVFAGQVESDTATVTVGIGSLSLEPDDTSVTLTPTSDTETITRTENGSGNITYSPPDVRYDSETVDFTVTYTDLHGSSTGGQDLDSSDYKMDCVVGGDLSSYITASIDGNKLTISIETVPAKELLELAIDGEHKLSGTIAVTVTVTGKGTLSCLSETAEVSVTIELPEIDETKSEPEPGTESETEPGADSGTESGTESETGSETGSNPDSQAGTDVDPGTGTNTDGSDTGEASGADSSGENTSGSSTSGESGTDTHDVNEG